MKLSIIIKTAFICLALGACATTTNVDVMRQTDKQYPSVDVSHVKVSEFQPQGNYILLAILSAESYPGETPVRFVQRLQLEAAKLGADYLWLTGSKDQAYLSPAATNTRSMGSAYGTANANVYGDAYGNAYGTANAYGNSYGNSVTTYTPAYTYTRTTVMAKAIKFTN